MSYVSLLVVEKSGLVKQYSEARNNHGFAPLFWQYAAAKYKTYTGPYTVMMDRPALDETWKLFCSGKLTPFEDFLMGATFDRVWIKRERIPMFVEALEWFYKEYVTPSNYAQTVREMADQLQKLLEEKPKCLGVALDQCSANSSWWTKRVPLGKDMKPLVGNGEPYEYDYLPLNILKHKFASDGNEHWEIYEHRDAKQKKQKKR